MNAHAPTGNAPFNRVPITCADATITGSRGPLFEPVTFEIGRGDIACLVGPNGVGKSLFLRALARGRAHRPFSLAGDVRVEAPEGRRFVFHLPQLQAPEVHLPYRLGEIVGFEGSAKGRFPWFDECIARRSWSAASGGERMRALLARAFASDASILLLDEPFNHLDEGSARAVRETMIAEADGPAARSILYVSHAEAMGETAYERVRLLPIRAARGNGVPADGR